MSKKNAGPTASARLAGQRYTGGPPDRLKEIEGRLVTDVAWLCREVRRLRKLARAAHE